MKTKKEITYCSTFGHKYDARGICTECGDDTLLKEMRKK